VLKDGWLWIQRCGKRDKLIRTGTHANL